MWIHCSIWTVQPLRGSECLWLPRLAKSSTFLGLVFFRKLKFVVHAMLCVDGSFHLFHWKSDILSVTSFWDEVKVIVHCGWKQLCCTWGSPHPGFSSHTCVANLCLTQRGRKSVNVDSFWALGLLESRDSYRAAVFFFLSLRIWDVFDLQRRLPSLAWWLLLRCHCACSQQLNLWVLSCTVLSLPQFLKT